jgi:hypothetical protein
MEYQPALESEPLPTMSLGGRLFNIFTNPGDVFDAVKVLPTTTWGWLLPVFLSCLMGIIHVQVMFSQPAIIQSIKEKQSQEVQKMVDAGKLTADQADQAEERMARFMGASFLKIFGSVGVLVSVFVLTFVIGLGIWLVGTKIMQGQFPYMKATEVTALAGMIGVLGALVTMFLMVAKGDATVNPGPMLLLEKFDATNKTHLALASLNPITFWYMAVLGIGLGKVANVKVVRAMVWVFGCWAIIRLVVIFTGIGRSGI